MNCFALAEFPLAVFRRAVHSPIPWRYSESTEWILRRLYVSVRAETTWSGGQWLLARGPRPSRMGPGPVVGLLTVLRCDASLHQNLPDRLVVMPLVLGRATNCLLEATRERLHEPGRRRDLQLRPLGGIPVECRACGVAYGLRWLAQALSGCTADGCGGDCLTVYNCCPPETENPDSFAERHRRTLRRVAVVDGPRVIDRNRNGNGCTGSGACQSGADIRTVEFVLTAGTPWLWTDPVPVLDVPVPTDDGTECITWCIHRGPEGPPDPVCIEPSDTTCATPGAVTAELIDAACEVAWPALEPVRDPCDATCRLAACPDPRICAVTRPAGRRRRRFFRRRRRVSGTPWPSTPRRTNST